jgi:predicted enzyme related to lactoylglutathione lyase
MEIRKAWVTIAAQDLERSISFYSQLFAQQPISEIPNKYAEFEVSGLRLGIYQPRSNELQSNGEFPIVSLCLEVEDLEEAIEHLTKIGASVGETIRSSHGIECYAYDPHGNRIILYQPTP